jgi:epoxyqueuosine reductase
MLYGCDICQEVCPFNKDRDFHLHPEMEANTKQEFPILRDLLLISNQEFKEKFGNLAGAWRGKKTIIRNAAIAAANTLDYQSIPALINLIKTSPVAMLRGTAAWSIGQLISKPSKELIELFETKLKQELDLPTKTEFSNVLKKWR